MVFHLYFLPDSVIPAELFGLSAVISLRILRLSGNGINPVPAPAFQCIIFSLFLFTLFAQRDHFFHSGILLSRSGLCAVTVRGAFLPPVPGPLFSCRPSASAAGGSATACHSCIIPSLRWPRKIFPAVQPPASSYDRMAPAIDRPPAAREDAVTERQHTRPIPLLSF